MGLRAKKDRRPAGHISDAALLARVRGGDDDAFAELYERHLGAARAAARALVPSQTEVDDAVAEAFTRVLSILQRGGGPEEAFRPYVLTCVRHACFDRTRHVGRSTPVDPVDLADLVNERYHNRPHDTLDDADLMAQAFASLPERWQLVLWSTEVDGRRPADVAAELDVAPATVASLAYRARQGLAEAYLAAHLQRPHAPACGATRPRLAVFVRDNVTARDAMNIANHLDHCQECRALVADLRELNRPLRNVLVPAIVGVPAAAYVMGGASMTAIVGGVLPRLTRLLEARPVFAGTGAAGLAVVVGATLAGLAPAAPALPDRPAPLTSVAHTAVAADLLRNGSALLASPSSVPPGAPDATTVTTGAFPSVTTTPASAAGDDHSPSAVSTAVTVPAVPSPSLPPVTLPPVTVPTITMPPITVPPITVPPINLPPITVPPIVLPTVPSVSLPLATLPAVSLPPVTVPPITVPPITVPSVTLPRLPSPTTTAPG